MANSGEHNKAGINSLPNYIQQAAVGGYLDLPKTESSPIVYGAIKAKKNTDEIISANSTLRDSVSDIFFKNSSHTSGINNIFSQANDIAHNVALRHYTTSINNSNVALSLHSLEKFNAMVSTGKGSIISMDTETLGTKGTVEIPGITELAYFKRDASTIRNASNMKALYQGEYDKANSKQSFLFGLGDSEYNHVKGIINKVKNGGAMSQEESVTIERMAIHSDADIQWNASKSRFTMNRMGSDLDELTPRSDLLKRAEIGLNKLSGRASGFEGMKDQTIKSNKAHSFIFDWLRQANDKDNLNVIYNHGFDSPLMNNIVRIASPHMNEAMRAQFAVIGGGVNPNNILDPNEIFNAAYGDKASTLYSDVFGMIPAKDDKGLMTLENITETAQAKIIKDFGLDKDAFGDIHHQADIDAKDTLNLLSYRKDGKLIFSDMAEKIKKNLKNSISDTSPIVDGKNLEKGDLMYFMSGVRKGPLDSKVVTNASIGKQVVDNLSGSNAIGAKEVMKFDGMYKGNVKNIMKNIPKEQQGVLLNAINSGAVKDNFSIAVLKNAYNQSIMLYGSNDWELSKKLQPGLIIGKSLGNGSFAKGNVAISKSAMNTLGASEHDIRLRAQGSIGDIDKAQKRYSAWFNMAEDGRQITQAKNFYATARDLKAKGVTKEDYFGIAFEGKTTKGIDSKFLSDRLSQFEYNGKPGYTSAGQRDMYHMYDRLAAESDVFLPAIEKIESTFGNLNLPENAIRAKSVMSNLHGLYSGQLEAAGISPTVSVDKLGYEKNVVVIPKNLFDSDNVNESIASLKRGSNVNDLGIELNMGNIDTASSTIKRMAEQAQRSIGAQHDPKFASKAVDRLSSYLVSTGSLTIEQAAKVMSANSSSAFVKAKDLLNHVKGNKTYGSTLNDKFDIMDFSAKTAKNISSVLANGGSKAIAGVTNKFIEEATNNIHVVNSFNGGTKASIKDSLMKSSWAQDIINGGKGSSIYDSTKMAEKAATALSESLIMISNTTIQKGKDFHFAIHKTDGKKYNTYDLVFGDSKHILSDKALDGAANVGRVELGTVLNYQGVPVIMKGGYKQISASHLDSYHAFKGDFDAAKMDVYDSYSYGMRNIGINKESIADAFVNGDMKTASSRINSKLNGVFGKLKRLDSNIYDEKDSLRAGDMSYAMKMYTDEKFDILGHSSMNGIKDLKQGETQLSSLNQLINTSMKKQGGQKSLATKIKLNKEALDSGNMVQALKIMMNDSNGQGVDPIAQAVAKWAAATGAPEDQVMNLMFAVHDGDAGKAHSAWGAHPSEFHPFGYMYDSKRPVGRQVLAGKSFFVKDAENILRDSGNNDIQVGFPIETELTNRFRKTIQEHTGKSADRVLTGNALFMSQKTFDSSLKEALKNSLADTSISDTEKNNIRKMHKNMERFSVNNGESVIANEVGKIFADTETKEYHTGSSFQLHKNVIDQFSKGNFANVTKSDVIGYEKNSTGLLKEVTASGTGKLEYAEDGRYLLHYNDKTNPVMKIGINAMDKSVGIVATKEETNYLRKHLGNFSVISNNEIGKHGAFNLAYNDLFSKKYNEINQGSGSQLEKNKAYESLQNDMNESLVSKNAATLARDEHGNVSGINIMSHDDEALSSYVGSDISKQRIAALSAVRERYAATSNNYDIIRNLEGGNKANVYKTTLSGMQLMQDTNSDKGVKFDTRVMETLLRQSDKSGKSLMSNFVKELYTQKDHNFSGGLIKGNELDRLSRAHKDVSKMTSFLNMYDMNGKTNESTLGKVENLGSILDMPFYKKSYGYKTDVDVVNPSAKVDWDELHKHMVDHGNMFGEGTDFVKVDLHRNIKLNSNGKTVDHLYLPNVSMASMGETTFKSTNYQKGVAKLINAAVDLKSADFPVKGRTNTEEQANKLYEDAVNNVYNSVKIDYAKKDGLLSSMFHARLKHSGTALNKELYQEIGNFTGGKNNDEDVVYLSQEYATRLLGGEKGYNKYKHLLEREPASKLAGNIEDNWGMKGIALRYPTILERSASVAKFRVAQGEAGEKLLGGRQIAQFRRTSYGSNADVDADELGIVLLDKSKMSKAAIHDIDQTYEHQRSQNSIAKMFIQKEYGTTSGLNKNHGEVMDWRSMMKSFSENSKENGNPFASKLDTEGIQGIYDAFRSKGDVGTANIPSFYLRQHAREAFNQGAINNDEMKLVSAFSESAEQKMIDSIKKTNINDESRPIDTYFAAMQHHDTDKLIGLANKTEMRDAIQTDVVKRYAYNSADTELAQQVVANNTKAITEKYNQLSGVLRTVMEKSTYKPTSMEMAVKGNLTEHSFKEAISNNIVSIKGSAQDMIAGNLGFNRTYQDAALSTSTLTNQLQKHSSSGIIGETAETASEYFRGAMNNAGEKSASFVSSAKKFLQSEKGKNAAIVLAAISMGSMALGAITRPNVKSREPDDAGMTVDEEGPEQNPQQGNSPAPIIMGNKPLNGRGLQINVSSSNNSRSNQKEIQNIIRQSFGGDLNIRMNVNDNTNKTSSNYINNIMMNSVS